MTRPAPLARLVLLAALLAPACDPDADRLDAASFLRMGGNAGLETVNAAAIGADGATYVVGSVDSVDDRASILDVPYYALRGGLFLAKFSPSGELAWVRVMTPHERMDGRHPYATGLALTGNDDIVVTGHVANNIDLGDGLPTVPEWTDEEVASFVAKYTSDGELVWARRWWSTGPYSFAGPPQLDADGNIVVLARDQWRTDFGDGPVAENFDTTLVKLDADGELVFALGLGRRIEDPSPQLRVTAFTLDASGEIAFAALARGPLELAEGAVLAADGRWTELFVRVSPAGEIVAARDYPRETELGRATGMVALDDGDYLIAGYDVADEGGLAQGFLARVDSTGTRRWRRDGDDDEALYWFGSDFEQKALGSVAADGQQRPILVTTWGVASFDHDGGRRWYYEFDRNQRAVGHRVAARGAEVLVYGGASEAVELAGQRLELAGQDYLSNDGFVIRFAAE